MHQYFKNQIKILKKKIRFISKFIIMTIKRKSNEIDQIL